MKPPSRARRCTRSGWAVSRRHGPVPSWTVRFALVKAWPVIRVMARLVAFTLLTAAPFLVAAAVVHFTLLTEYDINYYLKEKPPAFFVALGIGAVIVVTLLAVLLRLFTGWFFALPLILFEDASPSNALRVSRERADGHRRALLLWILVGQRHFMAQTPVFLAPKGPQHISPGQSGAAIAAERRPGKGWRHRPKP